MATISDLAKWMRNAKPRVQVAQQKDPAKLAAMDKSLLEKLRGQGVASRNTGGSSGGGGGPAAAPVSTLAGLPQSPLLQTLIKNGLIKEGMPPEQALAIMQFAQLREGVPINVAELMKLVEGDYEKTTGDIETAGADWMKELMGTAYDPNDPNAAMFANDPTFSSYAGGLAQMGETADTNLATDLAWFRKEGESQEAYYNNMMNAIATGALPIGAAAAGGGGGGGGRRGGGGGGSGGGPGEWGDTKTVDKFEDKTEDTRTDTYYENFPGFYNEMLNQITNPLVNERTESLLNVNSSPAEFLAAAEEELLNLNTQNQAYEDIAGPGDIIGSNEMWAQNAPGELQGLLDRYTELTGKTLGDDPTLESNESFYLPTIQGDNPATEGVTEESYQNPRLLDSDAEKDELAALEPFLTKLVSDAAMGNVGSPAGASTAINTLSYLQSLAKGHLAPGSTVPGGIPLVGSNGQTVKELVESGQIPGPVQPGSTVNQPAPSGQYGTSAIADAVIQAAQGNISNAPAVRGPADYGYGDWELDNQPNVVSNAPAGGDPTYGGWHTNNKWGGLPQAFPPGGNPAYGGWEENNTANVTPQGFPPGGNPTYGGWNTNNPQINPIPLPQPAVQESANYGGQWPGYNNQVPQPNIQQLLGIMGQQGPPSTAPPPPQPNQPVQEAANYGGQWPGYQNNQPDQPDMTQISQIMGQQSSAIPPAVINGQPNPAYEEYIQQLRGRPSPRDDVPYNPTPGSSNIPTGANFAGSGSGTLVTGTANPFLQQLAQQVLGASRQPTAPAPTPPIDSSTLSAFVNNLSSSPDVEAARHQANVDRNVKLFESFGYDPEQAAGFQAQNPDTGMMINPETIGAEYQRRITLDPETGLLTGPAEGAMQSRSNAQWLDAISGLEEGQEHNVLNDGRYWRPTDMTEEEYERNLAFANALPEVMEMSKIFNPDITMAQTSAKLAEMARQSNTLTDTATAYTEPEFGLPNQRPFEELSPVESVEEPSMYEKNDGTFSLGSSLLPARVTDTSKLLAQSAKNMLAQKQAQPVSKPQGSWSKGLAAQKNPAAALKGVAALANVLKRFKK